MSYPISVIAFHDDSIITLDVDNKHYTALKPIISALGLDLNRQYQKIKDYGRYGHMSIPCQTPGGVQEMLCLPLRKLNGWLFSINPNKVRPDLKEKVIQYQEECFEVLHDYWQGKAVSRQPQAQNPFDRIDTQKLTRLQSQSKALAWEYLETLGIKKPEMPEKQAYNPVYDPDKLAAALTAVAKEYDQKYFFVRLGELNDLLRHQRRATLHWLADQNLLFPGETQRGGTGFRFAKKCNQHIADRYFKGKRQRVYVISWKLLENTGA